MPEKQIAHWTMSMAVTSENTTAIRQFTNLTHTTTTVLFAQDSPEARIMWDATDLEKISSEPVVW